MPGFVCFLTSEDVPGSNITGIFNDETVFAKDEVTCVGHIIGAVVADTPEHAHRAARGVKITYEDLPAIITIQVTEKWAAPVEERASAPKAFL